MVFKIPIVISGDNVVVAGHTRIKAAKKLGMKEVPCIIADDLNEEQIRAFRLADNKSAEIATWDEEKLEQELAQIMSIDMSLFGFDGKESDFADEVTDDKYTFNTNIPQYEITGEQPTIDEMLDEEKSKQLISEIEQAEGITEEERRFLIQAAGGITCLITGISQSIMLTPPRRCRGLWRNPPLSLLIWIMLLRMGMQPCFPMSWI